MGGVDYDAVGCPGGERGANDLIGHGVFRSFGERAPVLGYDEEDRELRREFKKIKLTRRMREEVVSCLKRDAAKIGLTL